MAFLESVFNPFTPETMLHWIMLWRGSYVCTNLEIDDYFKGTDIFSGEVTVRINLLSFWKEIYSKRKGSFFQKGVGMQKS